MARRILIGECKHETNSFAANHTNLSDFNARYYKNAGEMISFFRGVGCEVGGFIDVCEAASAVIIPSVAANAMPGGKVTREAFNRIRGDLYAVARKEKIDGVLLSLHGAMVVEDSDDGEGELLEGLREIVGDDVPIACVLDLHANITDRMTRYADVLVGYDENPHVDTYERASEVAKILLETLAGEVRPAMAKRRVPILCPPSNSRMEPIATYLALAHEWEQNPDVVSVTLFHGFFRADIPDASMSVVAVTDNNPELSLRITEDIAGRLIADRARFVKNMAGPEEAVGRALSAKSFPVVLADVSDNPGGGAAGDATHVLKALLTAGANNVALAVIVDPETVEQAARAGIGARIQVKLGGKSEPVSGTPVETEAVVKSLTDGNFRNKGPVHRGLAVTSGLTAVLGIDGIDVVVCSTRLQPQDPEIFRRNGIDPMDKNILVVKSAQHYRAAYEEIASEIIEVDAPGLASQHPKHFPFTRIGRPAFPLDEI